MLLRTSYFLGPGAAVLSQNIIHLRTYVVSSTLGRVFNHFISLSCIARYVM